MKTRKILIAATALSLTAGALYLAPTITNAAAPSSPHSLTTNGSFNLTNVQTRLVLTSPGTAPGSVVTQQAAASVAPQSIQLAAQQDGSFELRGVTSGACLTPAPRYEVTTSPCGAPAQRFTAAQENGGTVFVHRSTGKVLTAAGGAVRLAPRTHARAEAWRMAASSINRVGVHARGMTASGPSLAANTTIRVKAPLTASGWGARVTLSNKFGTGPLVIDSASIAVEATPGRPAAAPTRLTFAGKPGVSIPAGGELATDASALGGKAGQTLLVTLHLAQPVGRATHHPMGLATTYYADRRDATFSMRPADFQRTGANVPFVRSVDMASATTRRALVVIGDSITDGYTTPLNSNLRWPDRLSQRLRASGAPVASVMNVGISGNKVTADRTLVAGPAAMKRFDRDVVQQAGVTSVLIFEGINDVDDGASAATIKAGLTDLVRQARAADLSINIATLPPFKGWARWTPAKERVRQEVNDWIRANSVRADSVQDFEVRLRNPRAPQWLLPTYDSGDHLHPNTTGFQAIASGINLNTLRL